MKVNNVQWPQAHEEHFRALLSNKGTMSFTDIALDMSEQFKVRYTRSACIAKAHRLGLAPGRAPYKPKPRKAKKARLVKMKRPDYIKHPFLRDDKRARDPLHLESEKRAKGDTSPTFIDMRDDTIVGVAYADADVTDCNWPLNDDCSRVCGAKATVGAYCLAHARIAYRVAPTVRRNERFMLNKSRPIAEPVCDEC